MAQKPCGHGLISCQYPGAPQAHVQCMYMLRRLEDSRLRTNRERDAAGGKKEVKKEWFGPFPWGDWMLQGEGRHLCTDSDESGRSQQSQGPRDQKTPQLGVGDLGYVSALDARWRCISQERNNVSTQLLMPASNDATTTKQGPEPRCPRRR